MDTLLSMKVFRLVAELKSFAAAAQRLGMSPAMVSKHVMHLERRLGSRLLNRTSRRVSLSEAGALYFEHSRQMLDGLEELEAMIGKTTVVPEGTLRLSAPVWMANAAFTGFLRDYTARYPGVQLDIDLSSRIVNLADEGFDLALRVAYTPSEATIARPVAKIRFHLVASPAYLDRYGRPDSMEALEGHRLLRYAHAAFGNTIEVPGPGGPKVVRMVPVLKTNNELLLHAAALDGLGLAFLPKFLVAPDLAAGRLEVVLAQRFVYDGTLLGVYPSRRYISAKVRTFLDCLSESRRFDTSPLDATEAPATPARSAR